MLQTVGAFSVIVETKESFAAPGRMQVWGRVSRVITGLRRSARGGGETPQLLCSLPQYDLTIAPTPGSRKLEPGLVPHSKTIEINSR